MPKQKNKKDNKNKDSFPTTTTSLPGLRDIQVIISQPSLVRENSSKISKK
jgi:hypothetical protein